MKVSDSTNKVMGSSKKKQAKKEKLTSKWSLRKPLYIGKKDERYEWHLKQLKTTGISDTETWSLDATIAEFILPRLKRFKVVNSGYPSSLTEKKWNEILDKMIFAFEWALADVDISEHADLSEKERKLKWKKYEEGMNLFSKYFMDLWW